MNDAYLLGHAQHELERLRMQAEILRPITSRLLISASIQSGSSVLDIGCGVGSVSLLAADLVGPGGKVLGIDRSNEAIAIARATARQTGQANVRFHCASFEDVEVNEQFDAVVGRAVLLFQPDVTSFLKKAALWVKPGGYLAFHEIDDGRQFQSRPKVPLWDLVVEELLVRFRRGCPQYDIAQRMVEAFAVAGLPVPGMTYEIPVAGGRAGSLCTWAVETLRSLSGNAAQTTLQDGTEVRFDSLARDLQHAIATAHAQVEFLGQMCAWVQLR